jgi:hypothetical protein
VTVAGLKLYGTPWTASSNMGFSDTHSRLERIWARIPSDLDVLITHMPPWNMLDLAYDVRNADATEPCAVCKQVSVTLVVSLSNISSSDGDQQ